MEEELQRVRERLHKIADEVQVHSMKIAACELLIAQQEKAVTELRGSMATSEQLDHAVESVGLQIQNLHNLMDPIRKGVNAVVWLIVSTLIAAVISLLLWGPKVSP